MVVNGKYTHGGDVYSREIKLDFSANVNPFGTPESVRRAVAEAAEDLSAYPDPYCRPLREKLAGLLGVGPQDIICGNGAAELIYQFASALKPRRTLLPVPSFSDYEDGLRAAGCSPEFYPLKREEGFEVTDEIFNAVGADTDLVILCSPNNPTGRSVKKELLLGILERCRETGTWLFLDECFIELTDEDKAFSLTPYLREKDCVFLLRAFTKAYGMAGARLGYGVCRCASMLGAMCAVSQPWNISSLAQAAGLAALDFPEWPEKARALIKTEKQYLVRELTRLGISVLPGDANYLMLSGEPGLYGALLEKGILIRSCANYHGLTEGDARIAVRTHGENEALIRAIEEIKHA